MKLRLIKLLDATMGMFLCWIGGHLLYLRGREAGFSAFRGEDIRRVLVIRPGGLGDMVLLQPLLVALFQKYPGVQIDLICERRNQDILKLCKFRPNVFTYDSHPLRLLGRLWAGGYDVVIDSEQFHYFSAVMALLSRAPIRIGYKINPGRNPIYTHLINYDLEGYEADEFMKLLGPFGLHGQATVAGCLAVNEVSLPQDGESFLAKVNAGGRRLVLVHVGASVRYKRWDLSRFVGLVRGLGEDQGVVVGLVGGKGDQALAREVASRCAMNDQVWVLAGLLTIPQTAKILSNAHLFVGGDSGIAHLAAALKVPSVVMFGPSDAKKWCRESDSVVVVRQEMACSPCFIFGYHKYCRSISCMQQVEVDQVLGACRNVQNVSGHGYES
jgi:ADP-heptose:LPS heptosyltransferase